MLARQWWTMFLVAAWCAALASPVLAAKKPKGPDPGLLEGTFLSVEGHKVTLKDADGKEETVVAADSCSVYIDGKEAHLTDLKKDQKMSYTKNPDGKLGAIRVGAMPRKSK